MYAVLGIIIIQGVLLTLGIVDVGITLETYVIRIIFAVVFSLLSIFSIAVAIFLDRLFLKNFKLN